MGCVVTKQNETNSKSCGLPEVEIQTGSMVKPNCSACKIVFVFGGPGSRKGRIVNDLVQGYGFHVINAEHVIRSGLTEILNNESAGDEEKEKLKSTKEMELLLRRKPSFLTLQWVLDKISEELYEMRKAGCEYYLVDLVPNLRAILQIHAFIKECKTEMEQFEREWPCMFALNLALPEEKVMENVGPVMIRHLNQMQKGGQSDEKDVTKTKKRYEEYCTSVKEFLRYFEESSRLATVNVSCGVADLIWSKVSEFFFGLGFKTKMAVNTVILFAFKRDDISTLDLEKYRMELIQANSLLDINSASVEDLFVALNKHIKKSKVSIESFVVDLKDPQVFDHLHERSEKQIYFLETGDNQLHHYIYVDTEKNDPCKRNLFLLPFKAVCTTENEICLFPKEISTAVCKQVTMLYAETKGQIYKEKSAGNRTL